MKKIVYIVLIAFLFAGCGSINRPKESPVSQESPSPEALSEAPSLENPSSFFVQKLEHGEANEYVICYLYPNGTVEEIVSMGVQNNPFFIVGDRIYYTQGGAIYSVDWDGKDMQSLFDDSEENVSFDIIRSVEGQWLYCAGTRWVYIFGDPLTNDGLHRRPAITKVKADFSQFEVLEDQAEAE